MLQQPLSRDRRTKLPTVLLLRLITFFLCMNSCSSSVLLTIDQNTAFTLQLTHYPVSVLLLSCSARSHLSRNISRGCRWLRGCLCVVGEHAASLACAVHRRGCRSQALCRGRELYVS